MLGRVARGPLPPLHEQPFRLVEHERDPLRVTVARPLLLPYCFGDCDLLATVALPAGGELDLAFRRLDLALGHGRFSLLRLSATREAWPWRTREQALFGSDISGGARLGPGLPASIRLEVRGTEVRANVAGRWLPPFTAADDRGSFAFVVRGGEAEVSHLHILPLPRTSARWGVWLLGGLCGLAVALCAGASAGRRRGLVVLLLPAAAAGVHAGFASRAVVGATLSEPAIGTVMAALAVAVVALVRPGGGRRTIWRGSVAAILALAAVEVFCRCEQHAFVVFQDPRLDLYFGPESRQAPFDALAKMLHGRDEVHTADPRLGGKLVAGEVDALRLVFLGGEPMMESNPDRAQHLAVQATATVGQRLGRRCLPAVFPTAFPNTRQQTLLFDRFYRDAYPAACVVLGIDRWDAGHEGSVGVRERLQQVEVGPPAPPLSLALFVLRGSRDAAVIASPDDLRLTLSEFAHTCAAHGLPLILATHAAVTAPYLAAVENAAKTEGLTLVRDVVRADETADVEKLAQALFAVLSR